MKVYSINSAGLGMAVHHNSPYGFDMFDLKHIGKGEGHQAHGYGLYFSVNDLKSYADNHKGNETYKGLHYRDIPRKFNDDAIQVAIGGVMSQMRKGKTAEQAIKEELNFWNINAENELGEKIIDTLKNLNPSDFKQEQPNRHHYLVEIPDNNGKNYLEEGKWSVRQTQRIIKSLTDKERKKIEKSRISKYDLQSGIYEYIKNYGFRDVYDVFSMLLGAKEASKLMKRAGFVGIHYKGNIDGECYVIFDAKDAKIVKHDLFGIDILDGLGRVDRDALKKSIVDLVTTQIFSWKKPWKPVVDGGYFAKVKGKVVRGVVNGYTLRPYGYNAFSLSAYTDVFNDEYKTQFSPIFVSKNLVVKNKWKVIHHDGDVHPSYTIMERFWVKIKDASEIEKIKKYEEEHDGDLPYGVIKRGEDYLRRGLKDEEVVLAENIEGNPLKVEHIKVKEAEMIDYVDKVIEAFQKNICKVFNDQKDRCFYHPAKDEIHLVPPVGFDQINEYYSTRFHESTHSTLHKSRLNRDFGSKTWGDDGYAMEELVAEIGSYMLCTELGINYYRKDKSTPFSSKENSMAYIASWLKKAKNLYGGDDEKTIVSAFDYADKAVDYILNDVDLDKYIPESVKELEDNEYSDVLLFENDDVKVVNVRSDERIRLFFKRIPSEKIREELKAEKFAYANSFKAWQVKNDEDGKKKVEAFLKKHYKTEGKNNLALAKAKMKMAKAKLKLMNIK